MTIFKNVRRPTIEVEHSGQKFTLSMISALDRAQVGRYWDEYFAATKGKEDTQESLSAYRKAETDSTVFLLVKSLMPELSGVDEEELTAEVRDGFPAGLFDYLVDEAKKLSRLVTEEEKKEEKKEDESPK